MCIQVKDHSNAQYARNASAKRLIYKNMKQLIALPHPTNAQFATRPLDIPPTSTRTWPHTAMLGKDNKHMPNSLSAYSFHHEIYVVAYRIIP